MSPLILIASFLGVTIATPLLQQNSSLPFINFSEENPECITIYLDYMFAGTNVKHCTLKDNPLKKTRFVYWMIWDCHTWSDAKLKCKEGGGQLASFPFIDDKWFALQFINPAIVPSRFDSCGYAATDAYFLTGAWIGLSLTPGSQSQWSWENGKVEDEGDLPINQYSTQTTAQRVSDGNCILAARSSRYGSYYSQHGYRKAACGTLARAVCMKDATPT